jgi:hypothetical protein
MHLMIKWSDWSDQRQLLETNANDQQAHIEYERISTLFGVGFAAKKSNVWKTRFSHHAE